MKTRANPSGPGAAPLASLKSIATVTIATYLPRPARRPFVVLNQTGVRRFPFPPQPRLTHLLPQNRLPGVILAEAGREGGARLGALWEWARGFAGRGLEGLLRMELALLLEREQTAGVVNWRNGYRTRTLSLAGLGRLEFLVPRDRLSHYRSGLLPFRKRRTAELERLAAEMFLAGPSTRDTARVLERHFGERFDSKEVSRMVDGVSGELDGWRRRDLSGSKYRFLFLDGANFKVRRNHQVEKLPFLAVIGARAADDKLEVLAIELGDKERKDLWAELFQGLIRRGLDPGAVELGIMDGLPGLEDAFRAAFANAATQRCQVHAKRNALRRVGLKDRAAFSADLDRVFYAPNEARARTAFVALKGQWGRAYATAVGSSSALSIACCASTASNRNTGRACAPPTRSNG